MQDLRRGETTKGTGGMSVSSCSSLENPRKERRGRGNREVGGCGGGTGDCGEGVREFREGGSRWQAGSRCKELIRAGGEG